MIYLDRKLKLGWGSAILQWYHCWSLMYWAML